MVSPRLQRWSVLQAIVSLALLLFFVVGTSPASYLSRAVPAGAWLLSSWLLLVVLLRAGATVADRVTIGRFGLVLLAFAAIATSGALGWLAWVLLAVAVAADALDGWCARRWGGSTAGAVLDMETDQLTFFALAFLAWGHAGAPAAVLAVPALRYAKVVLYEAHGLPAADPRPRSGDNHTARRCCACAFAALLAALLPGAPPALVTTATFAALAVLAFSYRTDLADLLAARAARRAARG